MEINNGYAGFNSNHDLTQCFINLIEAKDLYTQGHSHHVNVIVNAIFHSLPPEHRHGLNIEKLSTAALLHDIGKILTPDSILNKDGRLEEEEWKVMRQHPQNGKSIVKNTILAELGDWILYHHERIDGEGYYGLKGTQIPIEARIIAIADTFSALRTYRIYRSAKSLDETIHIMKESAGSQLDAEILSYFLSLDICLLENLECNCEICRQRRRVLEETMSS